MTVLPADEAGLAAAGEALRRGELVVAPTDTVYGVLCRADDPAALGRLRTARQARTADGCTVLTHKPRRLSAVADVPEAAERLMAAFWPGPLTLLLAATAAGDLEPAVTDGVLAVRMPADPVLLRLLDANGPLACSAASPAGHPPPHTAEAAAALPGVSLILDEGVRKRRPSTVVDCTGGRLEVRREGAIPTVEISRLCESATAL
jgi:L-threonylcarbamoyladenylate synthase